MVKHNNKLDKDNLWIQLTQVAENSFYVQHGYKTKNWRLYPTSYS